MERHFNIVVWGKVQGVTFRKFVKEQAQKLGIKGSVQNLPNGTVFIEAEAEEEKLNELIILCQKGSPASEVTAVKYSVAQMQQLEDFEIKELMEPANDYFVHPTAVVDEGCSIGKGTKIWHFSHVMPNCTIGENCNLGQNVVVSPEVVLGKNVKVQNNVSIYTGVTCEDDVFLGPSMVFTNVTNPRSAVNRRAQYALTHVGKGASIGANATIVCGHNIGKFAFIGAGAVVTKNVPDYSLWMGNPARQAGWMSEYGHRLHFNAEGNATCPESGETYTLNDGQVKKIA